MRHVCLLAVAALLAGCSGAAPAEPSASDAAVALDALYGTTWAEVCPGSDPERSYIRLNPDGTFAWSYSTPDDLAVDGGDEWTLDGPGRALVISWNDGFASTRYDLSQGTGTALPGTSTKSCGDQAQLQPIS